MEWKQIEGRKVKEIDARGREKSKRRYIKRRIVRERGEGKGRKKMLRGK